MKNLSKKERNKQFENVCKVIMNCYDTIDKIKDGYLIYNDYGEKIVHISEDNIDMTYVECKNTFVFILFYIRSFLRKYYQIIDLDRICRVAPINTDDYNTILDILYYGFDYHDIKNKNKSKSTLIKYNDRIFYLAYSNTTYYMNNLMDDNKYRFIIIEYLDLDILKKEKESEIIDITFVEDKAKMFRDGDIFYKDGQLYMKYKGNLWKSYKMFDN